MGACCALRVSAYLYEVVGQAPGAGREADGACVEGAQAPKRCRYVSVVGDEQILGSPCIREVQFSALISSLGCPEVNDCRSVMTERCVHLWTRRRCRARAS